MSKRMQDKVTIITGGASGIGEGMVRRFCAEGARVLLADVDTAAGEAVAAATGAHFVALDVSDPASWDALAERVRADYGRLDALLNNAGIVSGLDIEQVDLAAWDRLLSVNLTGVMLGCKMAIALMRDNARGSGGAIINTASTTSFLAIPDVAYTTSKAAVVGLTKSVAVHCATQGLNIRVNSLHPGATLTNILRTALAANPEIEPNLQRMSPMGRLGTVEEVAAMALFLASDEASFCTGGQYVVDGGTVVEHPRM